MVRKAAMFCILTTLVFAVMSCSEKPNTDENVNNAADIAILSPWNNTTREGVVEVKVDAVDIEGISYVEAFAGDHSLGKLTGEPFVFSWDMSSLADGAVTKLVAKVIDLNGAETSSAVVSVTKGATTTPVVTITSPATAVTVKQGDQVTFKGSATDNGAPLAESALSWTSSIQGKILPDKLLSQTADNFAFRGLVIGEHDITLTAMNSNGVPGTAKIHVTVTENTGKYAYVSAGEYYIGQPNFARSKVTLSRSLLVSKKEMTVQEFSELIASEYSKIADYKSKFQAKRDKIITETYPAMFTLSKDSPLTAANANYPVAFITYQEACLACNILSKKEGLEPAYQLLDSGGKSITLVDAVMSNKVKTFSVDLTKNGYRLPTEAEWEVAARGGLPGMKFPWGDRDAPGNANTMSDPSLSNPLIYFQGHGVVPVGQYPPNNYGLYDMTGNVAEMTSDMFVGRVPAGFDPIGFEELKLASRTYLAKGGSWNRYLADSQISNRSIIIPGAVGSPDAYNNYTGLRVVRYAQ